MKDLIDALLIRQKYNKMPFPKFVKEYEKFFNVKISEEDKGEWQFMGLNNADFLTMKIDIKKWKKENESMV